jgi:hypothetical protein
MPVGNDLENRMGKGGYFPQQYLLLSGKRQTGW